MLPCFALPCHARRCRAVFLHVITYNSAAMSLYSRQGFSCVAKLRAFYYIATGRTPDPHQQVRRVRQQQQQHTYLPCLLACSHAVSLAGCREGCVKVCM